MDCASHPHRSGCFLEVGLCIFKRKARLKQTGDDFVSVCWMNQQGNNYSKLSLCSLWSWNFFCLFFRSCPNVSHDVYSLGKF